MTFSNEIKKELSLLSLGTKLSALIELSSILKVNASISIRNAFININFVSESEFVIKRIYKLIEYIYDYQCTISRSENNSLLKDGIFNIIVEDDSVATKIMSDSGLDIFGGYTTEIEKLYSRINSIPSGKGVSAYLRGLYLGSGSMVDPNKSYHLEIVLNKEEDSKLLSLILEDLQIETLYNFRKNKHIIYLKNSETISTLLNEIGATKSMLELENIKVSKDLRNNINRRMNFEMANINKIISSSVEIIADIKYLESRDGIPDNLLEVANLRKENPEFSIQQIADLTSSKLSKTNVAYKLNKIKELAKKLKNLD